MKGRNGCELVACCEWGSGARTDLIPELCEVHAAQLEDFRQWLQQYKGKHMVTIYG